MTGGRVSARTIGATWSNSASCADLLRTPRSWPARSVHLRREGGHQNFSRVQCAHSATPTTGPVLTFQTEGTASQSFYSGEPKKKVMSNGPMNDRGRTGPSGPLCTEGRLFRPTTATGSVSALLLLSTSTTYLKP